MSSLPRSIPFAKWDFAAAQVPPRLLLIRVLACFCMSVGGSIIFGTGSASAVGMASGMLWRTGGSGSLWFGSRPHRAGRVSWRSQRCPHDAGIPARRPGGRAALLVAFGVAGAGMFVAVGGVGRSISGGEPSSAAAQRRAGCALGPDCGTFFFLSATLSARFLPFPWAISLGGFWLG